MRTIVSAAVVALLAMNVAVARQRGAQAPPCEPAGDAPSRSVLDLAESARCYDERWRFRDAERLLAASIVAIERQIAEVRDEVIPAGPRFVGRDVMTPPLTKQVSGEYPTAAAQKGITGTVVVAVTLKIDGSVRTATVVDSIPELDRAALDTVKKMRFAQTKLAGQPVEVMFFVPARFGLALEATPADWIVLAKSYLVHGHPAAALQTLSIALELERRDIERFGPEVATLSGRGGMTEPRRIKNVPPKYPPAAMAAKVQGTVILEVLIDLKGNVGRARSLKPAPGLEAAALDAVQQWTYSPSLVAGKPVSVQMVVTVTFTLR